MMYEDILKNTEHRDSPLPDGPWLMTQKWEHLLFIHFPVSREIMKQQIPKELELDTYNGEAWITILPFRITGMHLRKLPPIPHFHSYLELNVRTYVRYNGIPGIYFFSLDADQLLAVIGARKITTLPYFHANMEMQKRATGYHFSSRRKSKTNAFFEANYQPISEAYYPHQESLDHWLLERYYLWSKEKDSLLSGGIHHKQWKIHDAKATMTEQDLLPFLPDHLMDQQPLYHYASSRRVLFWPIKKVK